MPCCAVQAIQPVSSSRADSNQDLQLLSWSTPDLSDLQALLLSEGVAGNRLLHAMSTAHITLCHHCQDQHRHVPGPREIRTWAQMSGALLERGWCLPAALWSGWQQVCTSHDNSH